MDQKTLRTESLNRRESSLTSQDEKTIFVLLGWNYRIPTRVPRMSFGATHSCVAPVP